MTTESPSDEARWYAMHNHGQGGHGHSTAANRGNDAALHEGVLSMTYEEARIEWGADAPSDEARCTGSPTGKHTPDRMCRFCGLCGLPAEPSAAPPVVEPDALDALVERLNATYPNGRKVHEQRTGDPRLCGCGDYWPCAGLDAAAALVSLRGERDALRLHTAACQAIHDFDRSEVERLQAGKPVEVVEVSQMIEVFRLRRDNAALAASLDRVRADQAWLADLVRAHRTVEGIFAQRVILHEIVTAIEAAAALSPGEPAAPTDDQGGQR